MEIFVCKTIPLGTVFSKKHTLNGDSFVKKIPLKEEHPRTPICVRPLFGGSLMVLICSVNVRIGAPI